MKPLSKTLVILTPAFPAHEYDENWVPSQQLFVRSVKKLFPEVNILVLSFIYPYATAGYYWHGVQVMSFDGMKYRKLRRPLLWRKTWKKLNEINKEQKISAMLSFWCGECALVGHYFGKRYGIKHIAWVCGQDARETNRLVKFIRPYPDELVAKSDFLADEFYRNHHIRPAHIIPNGIEPSLFEISDKPRDIDVLAVGSLSILKQYNIFIEITAALRKKFPALKAMLAGDGEDRDRLKKLAADYHLQENLSMTGMLAPAEAIKLMQRAKIFLHPSSYEGFSMACLEALYAGAHVISFVKPMHHDIKNWHVVKTKEEMKQKALELLENKKILFEPVLVYTMDDSAAAMMNLLGFTSG